MKNILNQLGATASSLDGATQQDLRALGMNPMGPAVQAPMQSNAMAANPIATSTMMPTTDAPVIPQVDPLANNFSPLTQKAADYKFGNSESRGL